MKFYYKLLFISILMLMCTASSAQVGIGTSMPDKSAMLEVVSTDKGLIIPRVALTGTTDVTTITNGNVESLLVYNTTMGLDIKPGFYYWFNSKWNKILIADDAVVATVASPSLTQEKQNLIIADNGQTQFTPPLSIIDPEKINVYRNGIKIGFTMLNTTTIKLEAGIICYQNDEIRIVQIN